MGSCGCGDYSPSWRLPGPGGIVYTIEMKRGCPDCGTPHGIVIYQHDAATARSWRDEDRPLLPIVPYDGDDASGACALAVLDPGDLETVIREHLAGLEDPLDWPSDDPDSWAREMSGEPLNEAVHRTLCRTEEAHTTTSTPAVSS